MNKDTLLKKIANELHSNALYCNQVIEQLKLLMHSIRIRHPNIDYSIEPIVLNLENMEKKFKNRAWQINTIYNGNTSTFGKGVTD